MTHRQNQSYLNINYPVNVIFDRPNKECGGGYRTFSRRILKPAVKEGECAGEIQRTEHCNERLCPGVQALRVIAILTITSAICGAIIYYLKHIGIVSIKSTKIVINYKRGMRGDEEA